MAGLMQWPASLGKLKGSFIAISNWLQGVRQGPVLLTQSFIRTQPGTRKRKPDDLETEDECRMGQHGVPTLWSLGQ